MQSSTALRHPSTLLLLAANAFPIFGVLYWGWDVFLLLMLYWLETVIVGIWTIARITTLPQRSFGDLARPGTTVSPIIVATFFVVHSGIFLAAFLAFLWSEFSGEWVQRIHRPIEFVSVLIVGTGLWVPILVLFIVRGIDFLLRGPGREMLARRLGMLFKIPAQTTVPLGTVIRDFYTRVIILQIVIVVSGFFARGYPTITPLIILIAIKTVTDGVLQLKFDFGTSTPPLATV